jgi:PAS domain S-box-containing protein
LLPKVALGSVLLSSSGISEGPMHMIRTEGTVTYQGSQMLCLQDKDSGMRVFLQRESANIAPGDHVEVAGLALPDGFSPKLVQAVVRKVGRADLPAAGVLDFTQAYLQSSQDAVRGQVDATLEGRGVSDSAVKLELRCDATKRDFFAYLPANTLLPSSLLPGARVRLSGVIKLQAEEPLDANQVVSAFEMYLTSPSDIQLLEPAPWWTARYTFWVLGGLLAVLVVSLGWISTLRRQVGQRTRALQQEVAERKEAQAELARERDLLRVLMENTNDLIYFKDRDSRITECSKSFHDRLGIGRRDVLGKSDADFQTPECTQRFLEDEQGIMHSGKPLTGMVEKNITKDGTVTWYLTSKMPLRDETGAIVGTFGISKNMTAIKQAEAELENAHRQLVEASRKAGMAEVATSVLHNVGNVLNSVNVSATVVLDTVTHSKIKAVGRLAGLIGQHKQNLPDFFASNPKGAQIPDYLDCLASELNQEQDKLIGEIQLTRKNIEHINDIVMMQQRYAKFSGVVEKLNPAELIEDALRMNDAALKRHEVQIVRDIGPCNSEFTAEKSKILQILVNLIRNAKYACDESTRKGKAITLELRNGDGRVKFSVIDNGVGIRPENMNRIFNHGFTTRKDGHGFGLHSGALAAQEMGGTLRAFSDGLGAGARFTLELPVQPPATG